MKQFNLKGIAETNLILLFITIIFHWLSFFDTLLFDSPFLSGVLSAFGFRRDPLFDFGMGGVFVFMLFFIYVPATFFDIITAKLPTRFVGNIFISPNDIKFKKGKHIENLIRFVIFALMCLTPYFLIEAIADTSLILPFTFFHMILMAITTFTHGLQLLALYRIFSPRFVNLIKVLRSKLILAI